MAHRSTVADAFIAACTPPADEQGPVSVSGPLPTEPGTGVPRPLVDSADNPQPFQPGTRCTRIPLLIYQCHQYAKEIPFIIVLI